MSTKTVYYSAASFWNLKWFHVSYIECSRYEVICLHVAVLPSKGCFKSFCKFARILRPLSGPGTKAMFIMTFCTFWLKFISVRVWVWKTDMFQKLRPFLWIEKNSVLQMCSIMKEWNMLFWVGYENQILPF